MTLPHTYTDEADHTLKVTARPGPRLVTKTLLPTEDEQGVIEHVASVTAPKGADAVALAKAVLEAAGDTGHLVIAQEDLNEGILAAVRSPATRLAAREDAARSMRERAAAALEALPYPDDAQALIRALPLLFPDA